MTNDDMGNVAMNPTVVICTHQRLDITSINIEILLAQGAEIILVVSDAEEARYYTEYPIHVSMFPNHPLGAKWQHGVDVALKRGADPVIILGSDDLLAHGSIQRYTSMIANGCEFVGLNRWWIHHDGRAYHCHYLARQPLGGGRAYSASFLRKSGNIFAVGRDHHLDDHGFSLVKNPTIIEEPWIHAIKGDWKVLNPFNIRHRNIRLIEEDDSSTVLQRVFSGLKYQPTWGRVTGQNI